MLKLRVNPKTGVPLNLVTNIVRARLNAKLTPAEAAKLVHLGQPTRWVEYESGKRSPDQARWILFLLLTNQHPHYTLVSPAMAQLTEGLR